MISSLKRFGVVLRALDAGGFSPKILVNRGSQRIWESKCFFCFLDGTRGNSIFRFILGFKRRSVTTVTLGSCDTSVRFYVAGSRTAPGP